MASSHYHMSIFIFLVVLSLGHALPESRVPKGCEDYCADRGVCVILDGAPTCYCLPEWEGEQCDIAREYFPLDETDYLEASQNRARFDECRYVPRLCQNGGICQFTNKTFTCSCPFTHVGLRCETPSPCLDFCKNGGICTLDMDLNADCNCTGTNFRGTQCNIPQTPPPSDKTTTTTPHPYCFALKPSCNGGDCIMENGFPKCVCPPTLLGEFCDINTATTTTTRPPIPPTNPTPSVPGGFPTISSTLPPGVFPTISSTLPPGVFPTISSTLPPGVFPTISSTLRPGVVGTPAPGLTCAAAPCRNGRPCYNSGNSYICFCGSRFTGYNCETPI